MPLTRARLERLRDELIAEGADPAKRLPELQRRADALLERLDEQNAGGQLSCGAS